MYLAAGAVADASQNKPRYRLRLSIILDCLMIAFMLFVFVGGQPFESRSEDALAEKIATQGQGDVGRQIFYFVVFVLIAFITYRGNVVKKLSFYPLTINLMTAWCLFTVFWALDPEVSIRRVVLSAIIVYTTFNLFICVGMHRSLQLLRYTLAFLICASLISVFLIPKPFILRQNLTRRSLARGKASSYIRTLQPRLPPTRSSSSCFPLRVAKMYSMRSWSWSR